jgi:hypothetical protein
MRARDREALEKTKVSHERLCMILEEEKMKVSRRIDLGLSARNPMTCGWEVKRVAIHALLAGMGWYRLHGDIERANAAFCSASWCVGELDRIMDALAVWHAEGLTSADFAYNGTLRKWDLFYPFLSLVLSSDQAQAKAFAGLLLRADVFREPEAQDWFLDLAAQLLLGIPIDERLVESLAAVEPTVKPGGHRTHYARPLACVARGDAAGLAALVPAMDEAFRARAKWREEEALEYGATKEGQLRAFDFPGTAILRLAYARGLAIDIDTPMHPRVFIAGELAIS